MAVRVICEWLVYRDDVATFAPLFETCKNAVEVARVRREVLRTALNRARRCLEQIPRNHIGRWYAQRMEDDVEATLTFQVVIAMLDTCGSGHVEWQARRLEWVAAEEPPRRDLDLDRIDSLTIPEEEKQLRRDGVLVAAGRIQDIAAEIRRVRLGER